MTMVIYRKETSVNIDRILMHDELIVVLSTGGDFAEIFVEENRKNG